MPKQHIENEGFFIADSLPYVVYCESRDRQRHTGKRMRPRPPIL